MAKGPGRRSDHSIGPGKGVMPKPRVKSGGGSSKGGCAVLIIGVGTGVLLAAELARAVLNA